MVELTTKPIDCQAILRGMQSESAGATVLFLGTTRRWTGGQETLWLDYDGYEEMALQVLQELEESARARWPIVHCCLTHRIGRVDIAEPSVAVAVCCPHRAQAFEAAEWLINSLKKQVPIWKQENWADGTRQWVHPGLELKPTVGAG